jgi:hypothetical protein
MVANAAAVVIVPVKPSSPFPSTKTLLRYAEATGSKFQVRLSCDTNLVIFSNSD